MQTWCLSSTVMHWPPSLGMWLTVAWGLEAGARIWLHEVQSALQTHLRRANSLSCVRCMGFDRSANTRQRFQCGDLAAVTEALTGSGAVAAVAFMPVLIHMWQLKQLIKHRLCVVNGICYGCVAASSLENHGLLFLPGLHFGSLKILWHHSLFIWVLVGTTPTMLQHSWSRATLTVFFPSVGKRLELKLLW